MKRKDGAPRGTGAPKKRRPGYFACIGVDLTDHPRAIRAGAAMGTWTWMTLYSRKTELDGFVPAEALRLAWVGEAQALADVEVLIRAGLAIVEAGGWRVLRYEDWNSTREEIDAGREAARTRMAALRKNRAEADVRANNVRTIGERSGDVPTSSSPSGSLDLSDQESPEEIPSARGTEPPPSTTAERCATPVENAPGQADVAQDDPEGHPGPETRSEPKPGPALAVPEPPRPPGARRDFGTRRFEQPYFTAAFAEGVQKITGVPYVVPREELAALDDAIDGFAPPEARDAWVVASAEAFRLAVRGREPYHRGGGPRGWLEWLGLGSPDAAWLAMTPAQREAKAEEDKRRAYAAERRRARASQKLAEPPAEPPLALADGLELLASVFARTSHG